MEAICSRFALLLQRRSCSSLFSSVANDDNQADSGDDDRRGHTETKVAPEGEVVAVELRPPRLLADDEVRS